MIEEKDKAQRKGNLIPDKVRKSLWSSSGANEMSSYRILKLFALTNT
jgi:hypothetical protein